MQRTCRILVLAGLGGTAALQAGCVTSESSHYQRRFQQSLSTAPAASEEVALAFGLDDYAPTRVSVTAVSDR